MPNVPPLGVFGLGPVAAPATPTATVDAVATIVGETVPRNVLEIWATPPGSTVPQLVWSRTPGVPAGPLTQTYNAGTGAVTVGWALPNPTRHDGFDIKRPDGSLAGSVAQGATSFVDSAPRPLSGAYTVTATLGGLSGTPTATPTLNLAASAQTVTAVWNGVSAVNVAWTHPAYGAPHQYHVYRNNVLQVTLAGTSTSWSDPGPPRGTQPVYKVVPVLSGLEGGVAGVAGAVNVPALDPANVVLSNPAADLLRLTWTSPGGNLTGYEVQRYVSSTGPWAAHEANNQTGTSDWSTTVAGYMRVRSLSPGGPSGWVQAGPVTPKPPPPTLTYWGLHPTDSTKNRAVGLYTWPPGTVQCGEVYVSGAWSSGRFLNGTAACQTTDGAGNPAVWDMPTGGVYFRVNILRNGVYSDWNQYGPI